MCYNVWDKGGMFVRLKPQQKPRESTVMKFVNFAGTAVMLNLLFLLCCLPILLFFLFSKVSAPWNWLVCMAATSTVGPALCGLFSGVRYMIRKDGAVRGFLEGLRTRWLRAMLGGVIITTITVYLILHVNLGVNAMVAGYGASYLITYGIFALIPAMLLSALMILNVYIPYDVADWLRNGVNLIVKAPHWVLLTVALFWLPVVGVLWVGPIAFYGAAIFVACWFTLSAFISTMFLKDALIDFLEEHRDDHPELYKEEEEEEA